MDRYEKIFTLFEELFDAIRSLSKKELKLLMLVLEREITNDKIKKLEEESEQANEVD